MLETEITIAKQSIVTNFNNYKLVIEYCGTGFSGWQRQINAISVQQVIEEAIYKFSNERVNLFSAGRTDSGVHALCQIANFSLKKQFAPNVITGALNYYIRPHKINIIHTQAVDSTFHSRFSAISRHYLYRIINKSAKPILEENRVWWVKNPLNVEQMQLAGSFLIGKHDFTSFRAKYCQAKDPIKTLSTLEIIRTNEEIKIYISAPSFLHHMVRNIVGSLYLVGINKLAPQDIKHILDAKDRCKAGPTAPACGLYLIGVEY